MHASPSRTGPLFYSVLVQEKHEQEHRGEEQRGGEKGAVDKAAQPGIAIDPARTSIKSSLTPA